MRRRSTRWLIAAIVTLSAGILLGVMAALRDDGGNGDAAGGLPTPTLAVELPAIVPDAGLLESAEVVGVVDGDTIDVQIDGDVQRVRYFGIDTPERGDRCFDAATDRNEVLAGDTVQLLADVRESDQFGRLLRYVFDPAGRSLDAQLIAEGLGEAWRPDGAFRDELVALEEEAQDAEVGCLWSR